MATRIGLKMKQYPVGPSDSPGTFAQLLGQGALLPHRGFTQKGANLELSVADFIILPLCGNGINTLPSGKWK